MSTPAVLPGSMAAARCSTSSSASAAICHTLAPRQERAFVGSALKSRAIRWSVLGETFGFNAR
jgi:hypothetical protein